VRNLGDGQHYKLSIKAWGGEAASPHNGRDQSFDFAFRRL
jgi:hypothetical protein